MIQQQIGGIAHIVDVDTVGGHGIDFDTLLDHQLDEFTQVALGGELDEGIGIILAVFPYF